MLRKAWLHLCCTGAVLLLPPPVSAQARGWLHLRSGDSLPILGIAQYAIPHDSALLALDYQTRLPLTDTASLRQEVLQIWPSLRKLAEEQHFWSAAIRANQIQSQSHDSTGHWSN